MKLAKFAAERFLGPDDVKDGPMVKTIEKIEQGAYGKPDALFADGTRLSLNKTACRSLIEIFVKDTEFDDLAGKRIELFYGSIRYQNKNDPAILLRAPGSGPAVAEANPTPTEPSGSPVDDVVIPF
jgi:hypothetical protein